MLLRAGNIITCCIFNTVIHLPDTEGEKNDHRDGYPDICINPLCRHKAANKKGQIYTTYRFYSKQ